MESIGLIITIVGSICMFVGWAWTIVIAFSNEETMWGIICILCGMIGVPIYGFMNFDEAKIPLGLFCGGFAVNIIGQVLLAATVG